MGRTAALQHRYSDALSHFEEAAKKNPLLAVSHFERGNILAYLGRTDAAVIAYAQALSTDSTHLESRHNLAVIRADQGRLPEAISLLKDLSDYAPALETLSLFYAKQGQYKEAEESLLQAVSLTSPSSSILLNMGTLYMRQGQYSKAETALLKARAIDSTSTEITRQLGLVYQQTQRNKQALTYFRRVIAAEPAHIEAHYNMATTLAAIGQRNEAQNYMQRFETLGQHAARIAQLRRLLDEDPNDITTRLELAHHYVELDQVPRAISHYRAIQHTDSLHINSLVRLSSLLLRQQQWSEALQLCQRGIDHHPNNELVGDLHFTAGYIQLMQQDYAAAESHFVNALEIDPERATAWNNLGTLQQRRSDLNAAEHSFKKATQAVPAFADAHFNLGVVYQEQGQWRLAQNAFQKTIKADSSFARAYYGLAGAYEKTNSIRDARQAYEQFLIRWQGDKHWHNLAQQNLKRLAHSP